MAEGGYTCACVLDDTVDTMIPPVAGSTVRPVLFTWTDVDANTFVVNRFWVVMLFRVYMLPVTVTLVVRFDDHMFALMFDVTSAFEA
jgi:hypothetical protein